jgi:hypothetical protein
MQRRGLQRGIFRPRRRWRIRHATFVNRTNAASAPDTPPSPCHPACPERSSRREHGRVLCGRREGSAFSQLAAGVGERIRRRAPRPSRNVFAFAFVAATFQVDDFFSLETLFSRRRWRIRHATFVNRTNAAQAPGKPRSPCHPACPERSSRREPGRVLCGRREGSAFSQLAAGVGERVRRRAPRPSRNVFAFAFVAATFQVGDFFSLEALFSRRRPRIRHATLANRPSLAQAPDTPRSRCHPEPGRVLCGRREGSAFSRQVIAPISSAPLALIPCKGQRNRRLQLLRYN